MISTRVDARNLQVGQAASDGRDADAALRSAREKNRYVNRTFVQTSRGCHQGCTFCAEPLMNGLKFRYRPVDEVIHEMENCGARTISVTMLTSSVRRSVRREVMRALKGRGLQWQAGVTSKLAQDDRMLELAAESGCTMLIYWL